MDHLFSKIILCLSLFTLPSLHAEDQHGVENSHTKKSQHDHKIEKAHLLKVIEKSLQYLNEYYVFPDVAKKIEISINQRIKNNEYKDITSPSQLAKTLTTHLRDVSHDLHLQLSYSPEIIPEERPDLTPSLEEEKQQREILKSRNFEFKQAMWLTGNIGYLAIDAFIPPELGSKDTLISAMNFVKNTEALIIDLRNNGGGNPDMVAMISSYFFDTTPIQLSSLYWRKNNKTEQWWTSDKGIGSRYIDKEIYILTSKKTFSAAEAFTYDLKNLKRATIVGETTRGGANPGGTYRIDDNFMIWIPTGRAINPITKTNWEGVGVKPDFEISREHALKKAYELALKGIISKTKDSRKIEFLNNTIKNINTTVDRLDPLLDKTSKHNDEL